MTVNEKRRDGDELQYTLLQCLDINTAVYFRIIVIQNQTNATKSGRKGDIISQFYARGLVQGLCLMSQEDV